MLFPDHILQKLGFDEVKKILREACISPMGKAMVDKMQFVTNYDLLQKLLNQTAEFKQILTSDQYFPSEHYYDIQEILRRVKVEGTFLAEEDFYKIYLTLRTVFSCIQFFKDHDGLYSSIQLIFNGLSADQIILNKIDKVIDQKGKIRTNASSELASITSRIQSSETEARKKIQQLFKTFQSQGYTGDGQLTVRDGRIVMPILAEYKRKVNGVIMDESATGQTVFMEPIEVVELNNHIRDLEYEKRREIVRILTSLTDELRSYLPVLLSYHQVLTIIDFIRAKALVAIQLDAENPILKKEASLKIIKGCHPLLYLSFRQQQKQIVPLDAEINDEQRIIVVSGPNAGGKSVCLKTIGLLQLMLQHGLLVSCSAYSEFGVFKNIFVDIGDDQSLESDLSTYSAHLSHMKYFTDHANTSTLILIDEFGTGTDPKFGGPIAEAVLEVLNQKKCRGVITTHYSNLKVFAGNTKGIINASMLFDTIHLLPLYHLEIGKPGSSYAFEIAQKTGLSQQILKLAHQKVGHTQKKVDSLLIELERDQKIIVDTKVELEQKSQQLSKLQEETTELKKYLEENKKRLIAEAKLEAKSIIANANKLIENTILEIKSSKADKSITRNLRDQVKDHAKKLEQVDEIIDSSKNTSQTINIPIQKDGWVMVKDSGAVGQVLSIQKSNAEIAIGDIRSIVKLSRLEPISKPTFANDKPTKMTYHYSDTVNEATYFNPQIDIRGKRGDEALMELEKFIDKALVLGFKNLRILHGKGDGILRKLVRDYLRKYVEAERVYDEEVEFGGDGITIVDIA